MSEERTKRDREYQRRRRAAGLSWDQQPENAERAAERKASYHERMYWGDGLEHFLYRAGRAMRTRRHAAAKRIQQRNARLNELRRDYPVD